MNNYWENESLMRKLSNLSEEIDICLFYAKDVLQGRFELGEEEISKHMDYSYQYAKDVLKGRFELGEEAISKDANFSYLYAKEVLKGRFELGEEAIKRNHVDFMDYIINVCKIDIKNEIEEMFN